MRSRRGAWQTRFWRATGLEKRCNRVVVVSGFAEACVSARVSIEEIGRGDPRAVHKRLRSSADLRNASWRDHWRAITASLPYCGVTSGSSLATVRCFRAFRVWLRTLGMRICRQEVTRSGRPVMRVRASNSRDIGTWNYGRELTVGKRTGCYGFDF
jgi:hypothetical protein